MKELEEHREFLLEDFRQCHKQLRHVEDVRLKIYKYVFTSYAVVTTVCFAAGNLLDNSKGRVSLFISVLLLISFVMGLWFVHTLLMKTALFQRYVRQLYNLRKVFYLGLKDQLRDRVMPESMGVKRKVFDLRTINSRFILMIIVANAIMLNLAALFIASYFIESRGTIFMIGFGALFLAGVHLFMHLRKISSM